MPININPEDLFETVGEPDQSGYTAPHEPTHDHEPEPTHTQSAPEPSDQRYDQLQQTVNQLLLRPQPQPVYYPIPQQQQQPQQQGWQQRDFFTPDDARLLLTSTDPAGALNRSYNQVAEAVYRSFEQEMAKRDAILVGMHQEQQQRHAQYEANMRAYQNQQNFYSAHPDMADPNIAPLVSYEAQQIAHESQRNPAAFINATDADIYNILAQRVQARVAAFQGGQTQQTYTPPAPAPRKTFMERGGGARMSDGVPVDNNTKALREMTRFMRQGR